MSDRHARDATGPLVDDELDPELEADLDEADDEALEREALEGLDPDEIDEPLWAAGDPLPSGPNEDGGGDSAPPADVDMPRTHDDTDLDLQGGGHVDTHIRRSYEVMARRADIARRIEDLLTEVQDWARDEGSDEAADLAASLEDVYERLEVPPEDTAGTADAGRAESPASGDPNRRSGRGE